MTKTAVIAMLAELGVTAQVHTTRGLATKLFTSVRTIYRATDRGELRKIDKDCYAFDAIVEWLRGCPRHLARAIEAKAEAMEGAK